MKRFFILFLILIEYSALIFFFHDDNKLLIALILAAALAINITVDYFNFSKGMYSLAFTIVHPHESRKRRLLSYLIDMTICIILLPTLVVVFSM